MHSQCCTTRHDVQNFFINFNSHYHIAFQGGGRILHSPQQGDGLRLLKHGASVIPSFNKYLGQRPQAMQCSRRWKCNSGHYSLCPHGDSRLAPFCRMSHSVSGISPHRLLRVFRAAACAQAPSAACAQAPSAVSLRGSGLRLALHEYPTVFLVLSPRLWAAAGWWPLRLASQEVQLVPGGRRSRARACPASVDAARRTPRPRRADPRVRTLACRRRSGSRKPSAEPHEPTSPTTPSRRLPSRPHGRHGGNRSEEPPAPRYPPVRAPVQTPFPAQPRPASPEPFARV